MAKYVCDFSTVNEIVNKLDNIAKSMEAELNSYSVNITSSTSSWTGEAKNTFITTSDKQVEIIKNKINQIKALSEFIKKSSEIIESTDESLASLYI